MGKAVAVFGGAYPDGALVAVLAPLHVCYTPGEFSFIDGGCTPGRDIFN